MTLKENPYRLAVPVGEGDHCVGASAARVTVVEYGDFECPMCGKAYHAVKIMLAHFGDDLRFVFRHFPLREVHPHAELAAQAAEAAGAQGRFWPMHNLLFENQRHLNADSLRRYAVKAELDLERYDREMTDHVYMQRVQAHLESGGRSGARATPTFFVNGVLQDVSFGLEQLQTAIATALED